MTEYYVDTDGIGGTPSDSNPGTISEPWEHISKANSTLVAGDTVYLRTGTYNNEYIAPINDGVSGNTITYERYETEQVIITGGVYPGSGYYTQIYLEASSYISIDGIKFYYPNTQYAFISFCDHIYIDNCIFDNFTDTTPNYHLFRIKDSDYINFYNTHWDGGTIPWDTGDIGFDLVSVGASSHLFFNECYLGHSPHSSFAITPASGASTCVGDIVHVDGDFIVFKNCTIENKWRHGIQTWINQKRVLIDGCTFVDVGNENHQCPQVEDRGRVTPAIYNIASYSIIRRNVIYGADTAFHLRSGNVGGYLGNNEYNRIYNNTIYNIDRCDGNGVSTGGCLMYVEALVDGYPFTYNNILNNIFYRSEGDKDGQDINSLGPAFPNNNIISHNIFAQSDGSSTMIDWRLPHGIYTLAEKEANHADWVEGTNIGLDPLMVDPDNQDFGLQIGSPCLNAGTWLTTISNATNTGQTVITVGDATPFYSGAGAPWLIEGEVGDTIKTEGGQETTIQSLNYTTNTLIVSPAINIINGEGLSLTYTGTAPNIGVDQTGGGDAHYPYIRTRGIFRAPLMYNAIGGRFK